MDKSKAVEVLAEKFADVATDKNGRKSYEFDNHGLAAFAAALRDEGAGKMTHDLSKVDSDGCYTLPNGECISKGPCMHTPRKLRVQEKDE